MDEIITQLEARLEKDLQKIGTLNDGSEERRRAISDYEVLHKQYIEAVKAKAMQQEQADRHELERDKFYLESQTQDEERRLKEAQYKTQKALQIAGIVVTVICGTAIPVVSNHVMHRRGLKFEMDGTVSASHNRNCFSKIYYTLFK